MSIQKEFHDKWDNCLAVSGECMDVFHTLVALRMHCIATLKVHGDTVLDAFSRRNLTEMKTYHTMTKIDAQTFPNSTNITKWTMIN